MVAISFLLSLPGCCCCFSSSCSSSLGFCLRSKKARQIHMDSLATKRISAKTRLASMVSEQEFNLQADLLQEFYMIPSIDKSWIFPSCTGNNMEMVVEMSQLNLLANTKRKYMSSVHISGAVEEDYSWSPFPFELTGVSLVVPSWSGERLLIVRNGENNAKNGPSHVRLEIWSSTLLLKEIIVEPSLHGPVYTDGWFEGVSWSQDEAYIAYIAEEPAPARPTFGKTCLKSEGSSNSNGNDPGSWKGQGDWQDDWGEGYTGKRRPMPFICDINSGVVWKVEGIPDDLSAGQVIWAPPSGEGTQMLVFVGWSCNSGNFLTKRKLGMKYCYNRPCALFALESTQASKISPKYDFVPVLKMLTESISSAFSPCFSPDGKLLVFLSAKAAVDSGAHCATNSLHYLEWPINKSTLSKPVVKDVVPVIMRPEGGFPGLYCSHLLTSPWLSDGRTLLLTSIWFSMGTILAIDIESGKLLRVSPSSESSSWRLLSVHKTWIVAAVSSPNKPSSLMLGKFSTKNSAADFCKAWNWLNILDPWLQFSDQVKAALSNMTYDILKIPVPNVECNTQLAEGAKQHFEAIFVSSVIPKLSKGEVYEKPPLIVVLHGGPHSVSTTAFSRATAFLTALGFNLLLVNYRGSIGYGEEALQSLSGHFGSQDVADVLAALDFVIGEGLADSRSCAVLGGSHGGFLATHLIGQAPDRFVTAVVQNPVCNISLMVGISDIPDWCYVGSFGMDGCNMYHDPPSLDDINSFYEISPIAHVSKVKVPSLFLLGGKDCRVPIANGIQYVQALRSHGLEVKVIVFPDDTHAIDRPQSDFESYLNIGVWFKRFFQAEAKM
eukprot:c28878_g1_i1 orf=28-2523(+)